MFDAPNICLASLLWPPACRPAAEVGSLVSSEVRSSAMREPQIGTAPPSSAGGWCASLPSPLQGGLALKEHPPSAGRYAFHCTPIPTQLFSAARHPPQVEAEPGPASCPMLRCCSNTTCGLQPPTHPVPDQSLKCVPCLPISPCILLVCLQTDIPIAHYSMPFCKPPEGVHRSTATLHPGTIVMGTGIENSPYNFTILVGRLHRGWQRSGWWGDWGRH